MSYKREEILNETAGVRLDYIIEELIFNRHTSVNISVPQYSTKISEAWKVVEKMISDGFDPIIATVTSDSFMYEIGERALGEYQCCFSKCERVYESGYGKTAPEAICKAALLSILNESGVVNGCTDK